MDNKVYVDSEQLTSVAASIKVKANNILNIFQGDCSSAIILGKECLQISGLDTTAIINSLNKIFTNLSTRINTLSDFLTQKVAGEYDLTSQSIINAFNGNFATELATLLGLTVGTTVVPGVTGNGAGTAGSTGSSGTTSTSPFKKVYSSSGYSSGYGKIKEYDSSQGIGDNKQQMVFIKEGLHWDARDKCWKNANNEPCSEDELNMIIKRFNNLSGNYSIKNNLENFPKIMPDEPAEEGKFDMTLPSNGEKNDIYNGGKITNVSKVISPEYDHIEDMPKIMPDEPVEEGKLDMTLPSNGEKNDIYNGGKITNISKVISPEYNHIEDMPKIMPDEPVEEGKLDMTLPSNGPKKYY